MGDGEAAFPFKDFEVARVIDQGNIKWPSFHHGLHAV